ncbi:50S ribosomal protein L22 [Candidatus Kaiserbacteria bacterium RIFCSPHIGHO2_01_FULL_56_24]|uniref:Large ribosomal subunit protein uL22 n=1 Tax=Candidatus Kaiserbacteria bacterium RIFCSPHIGHO2_01_FULL_56_24 TaxID=1798487 RepID=A0A1F6D884_9BACT|nr:MAG: 50S ribosomal protein L22 [Candidatus Kaiserbacteria bacterium RIFCSPHIGHO2_01_FULL_56_24]
MKASLYNFKQSPRKVRLVADMIRGKRVLIARDTLAFLPKKSSPEIQKLLDSAIANARQQGMNPENLIVKTITVDKGSVLRRFKPMARGRAAGVRRTMSIVNIELGAIVASPKKEVKTEAKAEATEKPARPGKARVKPARPGKTTK